MAMAANVRALTEVSFSNIEEARTRVGEIAYKTPLVPASRYSDGKVYLKLECLQRTGSFKIRGAWNRMSRSTPKELRRGFVTVSAGNHGQAVAWCAQRLGAACTVFVPEHAVERKVESIVSMGAKIERRSHVEIMESMTDDRMDKLWMTFIHPFGDPFVLAGQGTIGVEVAEQLPDFSTIVVPVGGGGLSNGIATAVRALRPNVEIYGVQAEGAAPLPVSIETGRPEIVSDPATIADGIAATRVFDYMLPLFQKNKVKPVVVSDDEMRSAMKHLMKESHVIPEPAGASSLAAVWKYGKDMAEPVVCVVSGGNADPKLLSDLSI